MDAEVLAVTVRRDHTKTARFGPCRAFSAPVWTGGVYRAEARDSDGMLTWRLVGTFGNNRSGMQPSKRYVAELKALAAELHPDAVWIDGVREGHKALIGDLTATLCRKQG